MSEKVKPRDVRQLRHDIRHYQYLIDENRRKLKVAQDELFDLDNDMGMQSIGEAFLRDVCGKKSEAD